MYVEAQDPLSVSINHDIQPHFRGNFLCKIQDMETAFKTLFHCVRNAGAAVLA